MADTHILIVEDDDLIRRMYRHAFEVRGYTVTVASNGEEGFEQAHAIKPSLILLDIMMPRLNGLDMLKRLKVTPGLAHIPVVVLTNLIGAADAEAARAAGAVKYVVKSDYSPKEVADTIEALLKNSPTHRAAA